MLIERLKRHRLGRAIGRQLAEFRVDHAAPAILMYHRIGSPRADPWGLSVSATVFAEQMSALKRQRALLSVDELVDALDRGTVPPRATCITFDDGYADNAALACPILARLGIPATVFLATGTIGTAQLFWWDELTNLILLNPASADCVIELASTTLALRWDHQVTVPADLTNWRIGNDTSDARRVAYGAVAAVLEDLPPDLRHTQLAHLQSLLDPARAIAFPRADLPLNHAGINQLAAAGIGLGGHGISHTSLTTLSEPARRAEIEASRTAVAALAPGAEVTGFAYPHGHWDTDTAALVAQAGYRWAVTTQGYRIDPARFDRFAMPRIKVERWTGKTLLRIIGTCAVESAAPDLRRQGV